MTYRNKKILLMGLGGFEEGSGVSAAEFLASRGADLTVTDLKTADKLRRNLRALRKFKNIKYVLGRHRARDFERAERVVRNPDVPMASPFLRIARQRRVSIDNDVTLFFREYGVKDVIGVTGTRGKSTTAALIHEMARCEHPAARLGGNIGESPLRWISSSGNCHCDERNQPSLRGAKRSPRKRGSNPDHRSGLLLPRFHRGLAMTKMPAVLELSSFQLHDLDTVKMSPRVAVWTNFYPDHLNKYPSLSEYRRDKEKIFRYQKAGDAAVLNWDSPAIKKFGQKFFLKRGLGPSQKAVPLFFSLKSKLKNGAYVKDNWFVFAENGRETRVCRVTATKLLGEHNQANILAAICAARAYGIRWSAIRAVIREFRGVSNRLEVVKRVRGITFVNDCTATSPQAAIAALKSFPAGRIILITGGNSKGSDLKEMTKEITRRAKAVILVPGNANEGLLKNLKHFTVIPTEPSERRDLSQQASLMQKIPRGVYPVPRYGVRNNNTRPTVLFVGNLKHAVRQALELAEKRDIVLFSPGLTWLPRQNEFERGEEFRKIINV